MKSIGIVGCGAIGKALVRAVEGGKLSVRVAGVTSDDALLLVVFVSPLLYMLFYAVDNPEVAQGMSRTTLWRKMKEYDIDA